MEILNKDWLTSQPIDYELKKYKLLSAGKKYQSLINNHELSLVLDEIESHLDYLYKFKYKIDEIGNNLKILKGIDLDTMTLLYEKKDDTDLDTIINISEDATIFFEKIYKDVRGRWSDVERFINFSQIPDRRSVYSKGYMILCDYDKTYSIYEFHKLSTSQKEWKDLKLTLIRNKEPYVLENIGEFVTSTGISEPSSIFIRADIKKEYPLDTCLLPISKFKLFNFLKTGI
jgi:hypothetical protein